MNRVWGVDRYETAAALSEDTFDSAETVYVATGADFPDAVVASAAAGSIDAPVLLVSKTSIPDATRRELTRLSPARIVVVGGAGAVADSVVNDLGSYAGRVDRVWGPSRAATAAAVSSDAFASADTVYVANETSFSGALVAATAAASEHAPMLLVDHHEIPLATVAELVRLRPKRIVVVGGSGLVNGRVTRFMQFFGITVTWLAGADRYETARAVAQQAFPSASTVFVATSDFRDALAAGAAAGSHHAPVLLVTDTEVPAATRDELSLIGPERVVIVGGPASVSGAVKHEIEQIIGG